MVRCRQHPLIKIKIHFSGSRVFNKIICVSRFPRDPTLQKYGNTLNNQKTNGAVGSLWHFTAAVPPKTQKESTQGLEGRPPEKVATDGVF